MGCRKWGVLPVRKGFRVVAAKGALTSESRLTKDEAEGPRKDSGVRQAGASLLGWVSASPNTPRSKVSGSFVPFCLELGLGSPSRSSSGGEMGGHWGGEGWTTWVGGGRKRRQRTLSSSLASPLVCSPTGLAGFMAGRAWASLGSVDSERLANGSKTEVLPRTSRKI